MALTPFLMFTGQAEEAMRFYLETFPNAEITSLDRAADGEGAGEGTVASATFRIGDQPFRCIDSPPVHDFGFTPAVSFFYDCSDAAEFAAIYDRLSDGGATLMPPDEYPFAKRFAWVNDRFGVSWQLSLA